MYYQEVRPDWTLVDLFCKYSFSEDSLKGWVGSDGSDVRSLVLSWAACV